MARAFPSRYETHARYERRALEQHLARAQELEAHARELEGATETHEGLPVWSPAGLRQCAESDRAAEQELAAMFRAGHHEHRALMRAAHHTHYCRARARALVTVSPRLSLRQVATAHACKQLPSSSPPPVLVSRPALSSCHASNAPSPVAHAHTDRMTT